jgi:hypothetical protein
MHGKKKLEITQQLFRRIAVKEIHRTIQREILLSRGRAS